MTSIWEQCNWFQCNAISILIDMEFQLLPTDNKVSGKLFFIACKYQTQINAPFFATAVLQPLIVSFNKQCSSKTSIDTVISIIVTRDCILHVTHSGFHRYKCHCLWSVHAKRCNCCCIQTDVISEIMAEGMRKRCTELHCVKIHEQQHANTQFHSIYLLISLLNPQYDKDVLLYTTFCCSLYSIFLFLG